MPSRRVGGRDQADVVGVGLARGLQPESWILPVDLVDVEALDLDRRRRRATRRASGSARCRPVSICSMGTCSTSYPLT